MNSDCIFCKIVQKEIPAKLVHEDADTIAFHDIHPRAKTHILIIPKKHISTLNDLEEGDESIMGNMIKAAKTVAGEMGLKSYKLLMSVGKEAGQEIFHLHLHVMSPQ
jgi:histidine triad (HIT) family protein